MHRSLATLFRALVLCALTLPAGIAVAQQNVTGLHDDASGTLREVEIQKENLAFASASARLTFDVGYVYKSSTLVGEPLLLCGAELRNPQGTVSFVHRGDTRQVQVTPENAETINPHHVDLLVGYNLPDGRVFYAGCDTGIVGTWSRDPFNLASSPSWDRFLCEVPGHISVVHHVSMQPRPNRLGRDWCARMDGRHLDADQAKALFSGRELRASSFVVGSLSLNVADLVLEETRKLRAARVADRMEAQIQDALNDTRPGLLAGGEVREGWQALQSWTQDRIRDAAGDGDARARARGVRDAIQHLLGAEHSSDAPNEVLRALQTAVAARVSAESERAFAEEERRLATEADEERMRIAATVDAELQAARKAIADAPDFRFLANSRFEEGPTACMKDGDRSDDHWLVDEDDTCLAGPYSSRSEFVHGLASVRFRKGDVVWIIDQSGTEVYGPFSSATGFRDRYAIVSPADSADVGVIDIDGTIVIPFIYKNLYFSSDDETDTIMSTNLRQWYEGHCSHRKIHTEKRDVDISGREGPIRTDVFGFPEFCLRAN